MYHGFSDGPRADDPYHLVVSRQNLQAQLEMLRRLKWEPLDLDRYLRALDAGGQRERSFLVTIDDALASVAEHGAPVLARAGVPSILFTPPGLLGGTTSWLEEQPDEPILSPQALRALHEDGMGMGVHGWDHADLAGMDDATLRRNTVEAREAVADVTGTLPRAFAYPFGSWDRRALEAVVRAGYDVAFSVYEDGGRHAISRADVKPGDSLTAVRLKLVPHYRVLWRAAGVVKPARRLLRRLAQRS